MVGDDQVLDDKGQAALMRLAQPSAVNLSATLPKPVALLQDGAHKGAAWKKSDEWPLADAGHTAGCWPRLCRYDGFCLPLCCTTRE